MADDKKKSSSSSSKSRSSGSKSKSSDIQSKSEKSGAKETQRRVTETAKTVGDGAEKAYDSLADCFGGENELNRTIKRYNPAFYEFADTTFLGNLPLTDQPSKFLFFIVIVALLQSFVPIFQWPLDLVARWLGFLFLYDLGLRELKEGFESSRRSLRVKSLLTIFVLCSAIQILPNFLFDTIYHFGALWSFLLPVVLSITPWKETPNDTLANILADTFFASFSLVLSSFIPDFMGSEQEQNMAILAAAVVGMLFWIGYLGSNAAYMIIYLFLSFESMNQVGKPLRSKEESSTKYYGQMKIWHNLLAIWLWRYLISAIESISTPGIISVVGLIQYHLPSYFLWMTGFLVAMLITKKVEKRHKADTWYARWLMSGFTPPPPKSSSSSSSSSSKSSSSGSRSSGGGGSSSSKSNSSSKGDPKKSSSSKSSSSSKKK